MKEQLTVEHRNGSYDIVIDQGIRHHLHKFLKNSYSVILIITDHQVGNLYLEDVKKGLSEYRLSEYIIQAGEHSKDIATYYKVQTHAIEEGLDRNSLIIALGGGVVGDLSGFVAATFMRGIDYIQVPTTILAHDSSVGGKVAINHPLGKNLIGAFYPPAGVYFDTETLTSLSEKETRSGYAELVKEALISDEDLFYEMLDVSLDSLTESRLKSDIMAGVKVKHRIVEADEFERGLRSHLNLGHTFAHALEAELGYGNITHGEAVAIGLLFTMHVSERTYQISLPYEPLKTWLMDNHYPIGSIEFNVSNIITHMKSDKKAVNRRIAMVLLKAPGELYKEEISDQSMREHLNTFKERLV